MIIGRAREIDLLKKAYQLKTAQFVAIYGRRRIGKTFLVRQLFEKEKNYFELMGMKDANLKTQLKNFSQSVSNNYFDGISLSTPNSWIDAFTLLTSQLQKIPKQEKIILFFDELPWLCSRKAGFMEALDYFWNKEWSKYSNLTLIVCGSAASWMINHLINAKGGLHNRITQRILLEPFNLGEVESFLGSLGLKLTKRQIIEIYMVFGGVPYYLKDLQKNLSITQNIEAACFNKNGLLIDEFPRLFDSLFEASKINLEITRTIAEHHYGISRHNLIKRIGASSGGRINERLSELESTGFISSFLPYGQKKETYYKVIDEYSLFYLNWIEPRLKKGFVKDYWSKQLKTPKYYAWAGYAFESVCLKHIDAIEHCLGIDKLVINRGSWRSKSSKGLTDRAAQVDLLFERKDNAINICEIKFKEQVYDITKDDAINLRNKILRFSEEECKEKEIFLSIISCSGLKTNIWSEDLVASVVNGEDLFKNYS
jgi:hypothetical protein